MRSQVCGPVLIETNDVNEIESTLVAHKFTLPPWLSATGDGNPPHTCIGSARRMMVGNMDEEGKAQGRVLREAVKNHTPQAIVIDEISTKAEVSVVKSIAERGIFMVGFLDIQVHWTYKRD